MTLTTRAPAHQSVLVGTFGRGLVELGRFNGGPGCFEPIVSVELRDFRTPAFRRFGLIGSRRWLQMVNPHGSVEMTDYRRAGPGKSNARRGFTADGRGYFSTATRARLP